MAKKIIEGESKKPDPVVHNGFTLVNHEKLNRAIEGSIGREGKLYGGVGQGAPSEAILAEYDRLGGLVTKNNNKVKTGCFYDFDNKAPRETPEVVYVFRDLQGEVVEIPEGQEIPIEVKAAEAISKKKVKKTKRSEDISDED